MYDAEQIQRRAIIVSVALLPVAWLVVAGTTAESLSWGMWVLATVVADLILCMFIGAVCLFTGMAVSLIDRQSETGNTLMRFGAALGVIFFTVIGALSLFYPHDRNS